MKTMKTKLLSFFVLALFVFSSCDKVKDAIHADIGIDAAEAPFTIPKVTSTEEGTVFGEFSSNIDLENILADEAPNVSINNIKSIKLKSLKITLTDGDENNNFKALEKIAVKITAVNLNQVILAEVSNNPNTNSYELTIPITGGDIDIKNYLKTDFTYSISGKARSTTERAVNAKLKASYEVRFGL